MKVNAKRVDRTVSRASWLVKRNACFLALIAGLLASVVSTAALVAGGMDCQRAAALSVLVAYCVAGVAYVAMEKRGGK